MPLDTTYTPANPPPIQLQSAGTLTAGANAFGRPTGGPPDMRYWLGQKYANQGKQVEGEFQRNLSEAYKAREEGGQVASTAESMRALREAQGFNLRAEGQLRTAQAGTENLRHTPYSDDEHGVLHDIATSGLTPMNWLRQGGIGIGPQRPQQAPAQWSPLPDLRRPLNPLMSPMSSPFSSIRGLLGSSNSGLDSLAAPDTLSTGLRSNQQGFRKGSANVKAPSGKAGKAGKAGGPPKGLEAILPALLAAMQGGQGTQPPPAGLPAAPAGPAGLRKGTASVKGKGDKAGKAGGLEAILPALLAASPGGGAAGPQAAPGALPPAMAPGPPAFALGAASVDPAPGYPFGAGYLFGATAVPGRGSGTVDKVPAMLAPHEAVLNRAAADKLGRGKIAALNAAGVRQMGLRRGTASVA